MNVLLGLPVIKGYILDGFSVLLHILSVMSILDQIQVHLSVFILAHSLIFIVLLRPHAVEF